MDLIQFVVVLMVVGLLLWAIDKYIPMDPKVKQVLHVGVVIALVLWCLRVFGVLEMMQGIRIGP